jgi:hypothetical protein
MAIDSRVRPPVIGTDRMGHDGGAGHVLSQVGLCGCADVYRRT